MLDKIHVPPIKIQGIKTKIVDLIAKYVPENSDSIWYEPFMGSGVVGLNLAPHKAVFSDRNPYTISFYNDLKSHAITPQTAREFLEYEGSLLKTHDSKHYYFVRDRFNREHNSLDFLFLNRSCFNGLIRFNRSHEFNVPYGHKNERFSKAYITKITNQIAYVQNMIDQNDWVFKCCDFQDSLSNATENDFIYCDPPYIGRHVDYYDSWEEKDEKLLYNTLKECKTKFIVSSWDHNKYRKNEYLESIWKDCFKIKKEHFYHVGAKEDNRNSMTEALLMNFNPQVD